MNPGELRTSLIASWLIVTALTVPLLAAPFLLSSDQVFALAPKCEWKARYGRECVACGMTTAFVRIREGNMEAATRANRGSVPLFACLAANQVVCLVFMWRRFRRRCGKPVQTAVLAPDHGSGPTWAFAPRKES